MTSTMIKTSGIRIFTIAEKVEQKDKLFFYCEFCAGRFHFFKDHMDQVVCDPIKKERFIGYSYHSEHTTAMRCKACRVHKRDKTFNGRCVTDVDIFGGMDDSGNKIESMPKRHVKGIHGLSD